MATITTTFTPTASYFPFAGLGRRPSTSGPRAEVRFGEKDAEITLSGTGDDQFARVQCMLPVNYSYTLSEIHIRLFTALNEVDLTWEPTAIAILGGEFNIPMEGVSVNQIPGLQGKRGYMVYTFKDLPKTVWKPQAGLAIMNVDMYNVNLEEPAVKLDFYARFLQFDINQAIDYEVNTPSLVR